jgi:hypothetical protein
MSAVLKAISGGTAGKVRKHEDALTKRRERLPYLEAEVEKASRLFEENADASALTAAERALEDAQKEIARHERALADAQKDLAHEQAAEAAAALEARYADHRVKTEKLGVEIIADLVAIGKKLGAHESLVDQLPPQERFRFWPASYAEAASKRLAADVKPKVLRPGGGLEVVASTGTRRVEIVLDVPVTAE